MRRHWPYLLVKVIIFLTIAILGFGQAVLHLWNWLMPSLFGLSSITFWQAVGLLGLSWLLFGGWRGFHGTRSRGHRGYWRHRMRERWERMTPEEREKFWQGMRGCCAPIGAPEATPKAQA